MSEGRELRFTDLAAVLLARRRIVIGLFLGTIAIAAVIGFLLPETYSARTVLIPAPSTSGGRGQLRMGQLPVGVADLINVSGEGNESLIRVILKSRSLADSIVARVVRPDLPEEDVRRILQKRVDLEVGPEGAIAITVTAKEPRTAAQIAGEFPRLINVISADVTRKAAMRRQEFIEAQLAEAREQLLESEQRALEFQLSSAAPDVQEQARQTVEAAANLQEQIIQEEVRLNQLMRTATPENPEVRAVQSQVQALRGQLRRLTSGAGGAGQLFLSLQASPELKLGAARLLRDLEKNEQVYTALLGSLTEAQLEVRNDLPVVTVVDEPQLPEGPSGPRLGIILALAAVLGLVAGVLFALTSEWFRRLQVDPGNEPLLTEWERARHDLSRWSGWPRKARLPRSPVEHGATYDS